MDKTNNGNNKGRKRIGVKNLAKNKGNKEIPPKFENLEGNPVK